jgi:hypothetical protein
MPSMHPSRRAMRYRSIQITIALGLLIAMTSCDTKGSATVSCNNIAQLQTGLGLLNMPNLLVGNIVEIVPSSKQASHKDKLVTQDGDISVTAGDDTTNIATSSSLAITFSANIPKAVTADLTSTLSDSMQLQLTGSQRHQIDRPDPVLNRADNLSRIADEMQKAPAGHRFLLVFGGNSAQSVNFTLKNGSTNKLTATVAGKGFELDVNYQCQGDLTKAISAQNAQNPNGVVSFFKAVEIIKNPDGSLSTTTFDGNLADYNWSNALT